MAAPSVPVTGPIGPKRYSFAGIPGDGGQRNWRYAFVPGSKEGEGEVRLSAGKGRETMRWKVISPDPKNPEARPIMERLPDLDLPEQTKPLKGKAGIFQVHRTSGDEIYGTIQDGKSNTSLRFNRTGAGSKWDLEVLAPAKTKGESAVGFISALSKQKVAAPDKAIDTLTYPLTSDNALAGMAVAGGIGAIGGLGYKAFTKLKQRLGLAPKPQNPEDEPGWLNMAGKGFLAGAGASALYRGANAVMGGPRPNRGPALINGLDQSAPFPGEPKFTGPTLPRPGDSEFIGPTIKKASGLDYRAVISAIKNDDTMSEQEKQSLIGQAREASQKGIDIDQQTLVGAGLGALAAFIFSKMAGFGGFGTAAMTTFGALAGGAIATPNKDRERHKGGYTIKPFQ